MLYYYQMTKKQKQLWQQMADLTMEKCRATCKGNRLGSCCSIEYCEMAAENMQKSGEIVPAMPFAKEGKCVIAPHFRPFCSLHQCKINGIGFDPQDSEWTKKYFKLRDKLELIEEIV